MEMLYQKLQDKGLSIAQVLVVVIVLLQLVTGMFLDLLFGLLIVGIVYFVSWAEKKKTKR